MARVFRWGLGAGCVLSISIAIGQSSAQDTRTVSQPLLGAVENDNNCTPVLQTFNEDIMVFGRTAAASDAFAQCLDEKVRQNYRACNGDPFRTSPVATQIAQVLAVSRTPNPVHIRCFGGAGNASTYLGYYTNPSEDFSWGGWFEAVYNQIGRPMCTNNQDPGTHQCRAEAFPWPYSQAAGIVWHEVMHTKGYSHGANSQEPAKTNCGYGNDQTWHFQQNTMPYIVGQCIHEVISRSAQHCGNIMSCPNSNQLKLIGHWLGNSCKCTNDPGRKGLGALTLRTGKLTPEWMIPEKFRIDRWHFDATSEVRATGDFDGNGTTDLVLTNYEALAVLTRGPEVWRTLAQANNGTPFGNWNVNSRKDRIHGTGDFNGDGKANLVVTSDWGIGILRHQAPTSAGALMTAPRGTLTSLMMAPSGTRFGNWNFNAKTDTIHGIADINGDGKADLVVTSGWGIAVLTLSGSTLTPLVMAPNTTRFGNWNFVASANTIHGFGDFDGDGKQDILITSGWGMAVLRWHNNSLTTLVMHPYGTRFGAWNYAKADQLVGIGDFDGDRKADLLIRSHWGFGILTRQGDTLDVVAMHQSGTRLGAWNVDTRLDQLIITRDLNANGRDELLIRSGWGTGVIERNQAGNLQLLDAQPNGGLFGSWLLSASDTVGHPLVRASGSAVLFRNKGG